MRRYFTDLIIALLQDHLAAAALQPAAEAAAPEPEQLPEPMLPGGPSAPAPGELLCFPCIDLLCSVPGSEPHTLHHVAKHC